MKKIFWILFFIALFLAFFYFVPIKQHRLSRGKGVPVRLVSAKKMLFPRTVILPGCVISSDEAKISSNIAGKIINIPVVAGQQVNKNDLLLEIDPIKSKAEIAQAEAAYRSAEIEAKQAELDFKRCRILYSQQAETRRIYEISKNHYESTKASLFAAKLALDAAQNNLTYAEIHAPFSGIIGKKNINLGDYVSPGTVFFVLNGGYPEVVTDVSDDIFPLIKLGNIVSVEINGKRQNAIVIQRVAPADPSSHTHQIKLQLPNAAVVNAGAYVSVNFQIDQSEALAVPATAAVVRAGFTGVFSVTRDNNAEFHIVTLGPTVNGYVNILAGLEPTERIIDKPSSEIKNGTLVELIK